MSKKLNSTLHFLLVMLFPQIAYIQAQSFVDPKWSEKILSDDSYKVLVVVQKPVKVNELKAFKKDPELVKLYLDALNSFNANWTEAVKECWKIHQNLQYVSVDELVQIRDSLPKEEREKILVLACDGFETHFRSVKDLSRTKSPLTKYEVSTFIKERVGVGLFALEPRYKLTGASDNSSYNALSETWDNCIVATVCAKYDIFYWNPGYADLHFALNNIQDLIRQRAKDQSFKNTIKKIELVNPEVLRYKTLLIPEAYTQERNNKGELKVDVTQENLQANYPYPFKVVHQDEIDRVVRSRDKQYAVLMRSFWPATPSTYYADIIYWAVDATDCKTLISYSEVKTPWSGGRYRYTFFDKRMRDLVGQEEKKK